MATDAQEQPRQLSFPEVAGKPTVLEILDDLVTKLGGPKQVGHALRPEVDLATAAQWVRDCLNPRRRERFDPANFLRLLRAAKEAGYHNAKHFVDAEAGYKPSEPIALEDNHARLQRKFIESVDTLHALAEEMKASGVALPGPRKVA